MKKLALALAAFVTMTIQASAMSYEQAREQALFLTDKMAYELNLTDDQYEAAYEVNLDYLMSIDDHSDLFGVYWTQRNLDLSYILLDWQYRSYVSASYFYRPLYWDAGYWHFGIYARYPHRDYFYFGRPHFYVSYSGGHSWRTNGGRSWYHGRRYGVAYNNGYERVGMRDGFNRGDFGRGTRYESYSGNNRSFGNGTRTYSHNQNGTRSFGQSSPQGGIRSFGNRQSSTRSTVTHSAPTRSFGYNGETRTTPRSTFTPNGDSNNSRTRSFGESASSAPSRSMNAPTRSFGGFGGGSSSAPTRSFGSGSGISHPSGGSTGGHFGRGR